MAPPPTPAAVQAAARALEVAKMEAVLEDARQRGGLRHLKPQPDWLKRVKLPGATPAAAASASAAVSAQS